MKKTKLLIPLTMLASVAPVAALASCSCNKGSETNTITYNGSKTITMISATIVLQFTLEKELSAGQSLEAGASKVSGLPVALQKTVAVSGKTAIVTLEVYPAATTGTGSLDIHFTCKKDSLPVWEQTITGFTVIKNGPVQPDGKKEKETTDSISVYGLKFDKAPDESKSQVELVNQSATNKVQFITDVNGETLNQEITVDSDLKANVTVGFIKMPTETCESKFDLKFTYSISGKVQKTEIKNCVLKYTKPSVECFDFNLCDLTYINKYCTKLEEGEITETEFCKHFKIGTTPVSSIKDFIGLTKKVDINGQEYVLKIVGVCHDSLASDPSKKATFTFESFTLASDQDGIVMASAWDPSSKNDDYTNSRLRKSLTGEGDGTVEWYHIVYNGNGKEFVKIDETRSLLKIIEDTNSELATVIKPVQKEIAIRQDGEFKVSKYNDKLFTLTYHEVHDDEANALDEGTMYEYYDGKTAEARKKTDAAASHYGFSYWLPTPKAKPDGKGSENDCAWYSDISNGKFSWYDTNYINAVSFAFCI